MNNRLVTMAAALGVLMLSACSSPGTSQTGGGTSGGQPAAVETTAEAAEVKPGTLADAVDQGWLAGTATASFGPGAPGKVDVVATGPIISGYGGISAPIAVRNNTTDTISSVDVTGAATDAAGKIIGSGQSQGFNPSSIPPGGVALGFVYFEPNTQVTADSKIEFTVASRPVTGKPYFRDLKVDQANIAGENVTGKATNASDDRLSGPYSVHVTCFDEKGAMLDRLTGYASPSADIAAGQSVTFQIGLAGKACPSFLLGVSGYESLK